MSKCNQQAALAAPHAFVGALVVNRK